MPRGEMTYKHRRLRFHAALLAATLLCAVPAARAQQANNPLPRPYFSIDPPSPTIDGIITADDVLTGGEGLPANVAFDGVGLGLAPGDDVNALSDGHGDLFLGGLFVIAFSVDRNTVGAADPDPAISGMFPHNAKEQAAKNQAAGDEFMALRRFDRNGPIESAAAVVANNNVLIGNQADVGGVDHGLQPPATPAAQVPGGDPIDDMNAHCHPPTSPLQTGQGDAPESPAGPPPSFFFALSNASPSTLSGAAILFDPDPAVGGDEQIYAQPPMMGLQEADDIDALAVLDDGDNLFDPLVDQILFSLAPDSPSLALLGVGPADILTTTPDLFPAHFATANNLGLLATDNVNSLDIVPCADLDMCINDFAIFSDPTAVPTVSEWGLLVMVLLMAVAAAVILRQRGPDRPSVA